MAGRPYTVVSEQAPPAWPDPPPIGLRVGVFVDPARPAAGRVGRPAEWLLTPGGVLFTGSALFTHLLLSVRDRRTPAACPALYN